jgi:hypothetical protein
MSDIPHRTKSEQAKASKAASHICSSTGYYWRSLLEARQTAPLLSQKSVMAGSREKNVPASIKSGTVCRPRVDLPTISFRNKRTLSLKKSI